MDTAPIIILISLESETMRRERLKARFPKSYGTFNIIDAIDKKKISSNDYFQPMMHTYKHMGKIISPAELGCALSHISAMQHFLDSNHAHCLILEDDVMGTEEGLMTALDAISRTVGDSITFCGTHINRKHNKYPKKSAHKIKKINPLEKHFIAGAFSYGLTRSAAEKIISKQKSMIYRADHWMSLAKDLDIYLIDVLKHPEDYAESSIEPERIIIHKTTLDKIIYDGVWATIKRNLFKLILSTRIK